MIDSIDKKTSQQLSCEAFEKLYGILAILLAT